MTVIDMTFALQLVGVVALGSFAGEFRRTTVVTKEPPNTSVVNFIAAMLGSAFLSFLMACAIYEYKGDKTAAFLAGGFLSYQEEALVLRYAHQVAKRFSRAWKTMFE